MIPPFFFPAQLSYFLWRLPATAFRVEQQIQSEPWGGTPLLRPQISTITLLYPKPLNCPRVEISYSPYNHQLSKENRTNCKCLQNKKKKYHEHWKVITVTYLPLLPLEGGGDGSDLLKSTKLKPCCLFVVVTLVLFGLGF